MIWYVKYPISNMKYNITIQYVKHDKTQYMVYMILIIWNTICIYIYIKWYEYTIGYMIFDIWYLIYDICNIWYVEYASSGPTNDNAKGSMRWCTFFSRTASSRKQMSKGKRRTGVKSVKYFGFLMWFCQSRGPVKLAGFPQHPQIADTLWHVAAVPRNGCHGKRWQPER